MKIKLKKSKNPAEKAKPKAKILAPKKVKPLKKRVLSPAKNEKIITKVSKPISKKSESKEVKALKKQMADLEELSKKLDKGMDVDVKAITSERYEAEDLTKNFTDGYGDDILYSDGVVKGTIGSHTMKGRAKVGTASDWVATQDMTKAQRAEYIRRCAEERKAQRKERVADVEELLFMTPEAKIKHIVKKLKELHNISWSIPLSDAISRLLTEIGEFK